MNAFRNIKCLVVLTDDGYCEKCFRKGKMCIGLGVKGLKNSMMVFTGQL